MVLQQAISVDEISKKYIQEVQEINQYDGIEEFYQLEKKLLFEIYHLDNRNAKKTIVKLIELITTRFGKDAVRAVRDYLVTLSSIVARRLLENQVPPKKALAFNICCFEMIKNDMNDVEFMQFSESLIDFFIYIIVDRKQPVIKHQTVNRVLVHINDELENNLTVENIANHFHISTSHLSRIFKECMGITLVEYLNIRRVEESQYYLRHTTKSITAIASQFRFCNQSYFTRIFKKYTGVTPKHFRDDLHHEFFYLHSANNCCIESKETDVEDPLSL